MGRPTKRAKKTRTKDEFDLRRLQASLATPSDPVGTFAWTLSDIRNARDEQLRGRFDRPHAMHESMGSDDAIAPVFESRLAPLQSIDVEVVPCASNSKAKSIANEGEGLFGRAGIATTFETMASIHACLVDHGVAFGYCRHRVREDGSRVDLVLSYWPIRWVRWDTIARGFVTQVEPSEGAELEAEASGVGVGNSVPIVHGDGRWVVFSKLEARPWTRACILPAALVWARHAFAARDWAKASTAHGNAKIVGELAEGVSITDDEGSLTEHAAAFLELLRDLNSIESPAGIRPAGSKTEFIVNSSTAWQVWKELILNADKAAARIYLGTDASLGSVGGAPGVDIATLFDVATTRVQGDFGCLTRGIQTGVVEPWCAINFGDSKLAPMRRYKMPDVDAQRRAEDLAKRLELFHDAVRRHRDNGFELSPEYLEDLAGQLDVPLPSLPEESKKAPTIALAPTDFAGVVSVNEARASAGLGPLLLGDGTADPRGKLTVGEFTADNEAKADAESDPAPLRSLRPPAAE